MKLGAETGSLINHVMASSAQRAPEIGMAATVCGWTDRYPATVEFVAPGAAFIAVREDSYKSVPGHSNAFTEEQKWTYSPNPEGHVYFFISAESGWKETSYNAATHRFKIGKSGKGLVLGRREKYVDPSF